MRYLREVTELDPADLRHLYVQFADIIAARITAGVYTIKLPAERDLAEEFRVSYVTARKGMAVLRDRGLTVSIHGRGTFVAPAHRLTQPGAAAQPAPR